MSLSIRNTLSAFFIACFLLLNTASIFAQPSKDGTVLPQFEQPAASDQLFDSAAANKALHLIKTNAESEKITVQDIQSELLTLNKFQQQAKKCADTSAKELDKLNQRLTEITTIAKPLQNAKNAALTEEQKYLNTKKEDLSKQLSECRLFSLRAEEETTDLNNALRELLTTRLLYAHPNIFETLKHTSKGIDNSLQKFDLQSLKDDSGLTFFENKNTPLLLLPLFALLAIFYSRNRLKKKIIPYIGNATEVSFSLHLKQALIAILSRYLPTFAAGIVLAVFFSTFTHSLITPSYLAFTSYAFLIYVFYLALIRFYFYPPAPAEGFTSLPKRAAKKLTRNLSQLGGLCFLTYVIYTFLNTQHIDHTLIDLFRSTLITLFAINFVLIVWAIKDVPLINRQPTFFKFLINFSLIAFLWFVLSTEYLGYHLLASYLLLSALITLFITFFTRLLNKVITHLFNRFKDAQKLRASFGLKRHERLVEMLWLRALLYTVLWLGFLIAMLKVWGLAQANFQTFVNYLLSGFDIGKLHIVPLRIVEGALFFIIFALFTRWLRAYIIRKSAWELEDGSRESLASIIGYLGFAAAFILGALIAGVNFSGLALIAGALAVGIGFGLQNIVNNFVSGIILLIERPVKLGDRIVIGQTEGYVKKISIRSTRITTPQWSDVIVPNSELISQQVVNYMLHDMNFKVSTTVGIAYGSDTDLAKNVLLSVARTHPQVIADRKDVEPMVYFKHFGDSSLTFELICMIKDVNMRFEVISDLNFAIDKAFKEKGIDIAFPQQEIRITEWPSRPPV